MREGIEFRPNSIIEDIHSLCSWHRTHNGGRSKAPWPECNTADVTDGMDPGPCFNC